MAVINYLKSGKKGASITPYHITQTINGDNCTLSFTDYDDTITTNNYLVAIYVDENTDTQKIYILDEYSGS